MSLAGNRLTQVFTFLREFTTLQNPTIRNLSTNPYCFLLAEAPSHPFITVPIRQGDAEGENFILRVRRPLLTHPPKLDGLLAEWVSVSQDTEKQPGKRDAINRSTEEGTVTENFADLPERILAWDLWLNSWRNWAEAERPNRVADRFFQKIYNMRALMERESESFELVLGDGMVSCAEAEILHPVVIQRVTLEFEPKLPQFTIRIADSEPELNVSLLWEIPERNVEEITKCKREFVEQDLSPGDPEGLKPFLNRLQMVVPHGQFFETAPTEPTRCFIFPSPILFLRRRSGGFNTAIQHILNAIPAMDQQEVLPPALLQVCGIANPTLVDWEETQEEGPREPTDSTYGNERQDILFTKPANREQVQIIDRLKRHGTVIVQGPPGTGKSYTIGNIIGHLLAQGDRILVTAHTTKALQVVRDQVVDELRPLCVAVLGDDANANAELEKAVSSILEHLDNDPKQLDGEAARLAEERRRLLEEIKTTRALAMLVRSNEYRELTIGGKPVSPSEAARKVRDGTDTDDWIPEPTIESDRLPIQEGDIHRLYSTNAEITEAEESELSWESPNSSELPNPQNFRRFVDVFAHAAEADTNSGTKFWKRKLQQADGELLEKAKDLAEAIPKLLEAQPWCFHVAAEAMTSEELRTKWVNTAEAIKKVTLEAHEYNSICADHGPELAEPHGVPEEEIPAHFAEMEKHARENGQIGAFTLFLKPKWKALINASSVNGKKPKKPEEFTAIGKLVLIRESRRLLVLRWERTLAPLGGHSTDQLGNAPEQILIHYASEIEKLVDWQGDYLEPLKALLDEAGFDWEVFCEAIPQEFSANGHLTRLRTAIGKNLPPVLAARINAHNLKEATEQIQHATSELERICGKPECSRISQALMTAVANRDCETYSEAYDALRGLERKKPVLTTRTELLEKVAEFAPAWAEAVRSRRCPHNSGCIPGDLNSAWYWLRLKQELENRAAQAPENLDRQIEGMTQRLFLLTSTIAAKLAWAQQIRRLEKNQQAKMALVGWQQTHQRLGKGKIIGAAAKRLSARAEMRNAKEAVPVWVMPLKKVLENFDPITTRFDTIIIDEASQCDIMGLVPLFMARSIIVVGDHEQVSPDAVGMKQEDIDRIVQLNLDDIPQKHLYDGKASIYQFAQRAFSGMIMLREHFRCDAKIINYSNRLAYGGKIVPLRDTSCVPTKPPVVAIKVDGVCIDKRNQIEAEMIASLIAACLERKEYKEQNGAYVTYGVISLVGTEQAELIRTILTQQLDLATIENHKIICGNPAQFQGDERDIIFLSMVDSPSGGGPIRLRSEDRFKKRFNVAASRARNQEWLVYSLDQSIDLQQHDLRRGLIEYFRAPDSIEERIQNAVLRAESEFERRVLRRLVGENYLVHPQWKVGKYRIDLVIEGQNSKLAVELDGDRYHPPEQLAEDMERQAMLERAGWKFVRIRGSKYFRDEESSLKPLYEKLAQLGIHPIAGLDHKNSITAQDESVQEIHARAAEILADWKNNTGKPINIRRTNETSSPTVIATIAPPTQTELAGSTRPPEPIYTEQPRASVAGTRSNGDLFAQNSNGCSLPTQETTLQTTKPLERPYTITRFSKFSGRSLYEIRKLAWREIHWADDDSPMPKQGAEKLAKCLGVEIT